MTPEQALAKALGEDIEKQKLASEMDELSVEELEGLLKEAKPLSPEGKKYYSSMGNYGAVGAGIGSAAGALASQKPLVAGLAGGAGSLAGMLAHRMKKGPAPAEKKASAEEKVAMADKWGREIAQADFKKEALGLGGIGQMATNLVSKAKPLATKALAAAKPALASGAKALGGMSAGQVAKGGAMVGAGLGAAKGLVAPGRDQYGQQKSRLGGMVGGAAKGGLMGAGAGVGAQALAKKLPLG